MISEIKKYPYDFKKQKQIWDKNHNDISDSGKIDIIIELSSADSIFGYIKIISEIIFDIASDSQEFIHLLEEIILRIKGDMAQGPFIDALMKIGEQKGESAKKLYEKLTSSDNKDLKLYSSALIAGIGKKDKTFFIKELTSAKDTFSKRVSIKAIDLYYEDKDTFDKKVIEFIHGLRNNKEFYPDLAGFCVSNYKKERKLFFDILGEIISSDNEEAIHKVFQTLTYTDVLNSDEFFELLDKTDIQSGMIIDEVLHCLIKFPKQTEKIVSLFIEWTNKGRFEVGLRNYDWVLEEISKANPSVIQEFFKRKSELKHPYFFQGIFRITTKNNIDEAIRILDNITDNTEFYELAKITIGYIYHSNEYFHKAKKIYKLASEIAKSKSYISNKEIELRKLDSGRKEDYNLLIDKISDLLEKINTRKENYDLQRIKANLSKYPQIKPFVENVIKKCNKNRTYSPLFWLGEYKKPELDDSDLQNPDNDLFKLIEINHTLNQFWPEVYLKEINDALKHYLNIQNEKYDTKEKKKKTIQDKFSDDKGFWNFSSELILTNKFASAGKLLKIEPKLNDKNLDLLIKLDGNHAYCEITRPDMNRRLKLANGAVTVSNKAKDVIEKKYLQMLKAEGYELIKERGDRFLIFIDTSDSMIDEYSILNAFYGDLVYTWKIDRKTGEVVDNGTKRRADSIIHKKQKAREIISAVVYYKQRLRMDNNHNPSSYLEGDILLNPHALNQLSDKEVKELKSILFSS